MSEDKRRETQGTAQQQDSVGDRRPQRERARLETVRHRNIVQSKREMSYRERETGNRSQRGHTVTESVGKQVERSRGQWGGRQARGEQGQGTSVDRLGDGGNRQ